MIRYHLGNEYKSIKDMCEKYNIKIATYYNRIKAVWSIEKALTHKVKNNCVKDHLGNRYNNMLEMTSHYGISVSTYIGRIQSLIL